MAYINVQKVVNGAGLVGTFGHMAENLDNAQNVVAPVANTAMAGAQLPSSIVLNPLNSPDIYGLAAITVAQAGSNIVGGCNRE